MGKVGRFMSWGEAPVTHPLHWLTARVAAMPPSPQGGHPMGDGQGRLLGGLDLLRG